MRRWSYVVIAALLLACGDNTPGFDAFEARSGKRIALRIFQYADGARQWDGTLFFDRERQERCTVQRWSDGYTYCTPPAVPTVYSEPNCVDGELGRWLTTQPAPTHFYRELTLIGGEVITRMFRRIGEVAPPLTTYEITGGACVESQSAGWTYYSLGEELPNARFVRMKHLSAEGESRLGLDAYTTDDGLYIPIEIGGAPSLRDRVLDNECKVVASPNAETTSCEPAYAGEAQFSRDVTCAANDVLVIEATTSVPEVIVRDQEGCRQYTRRGAEIEHVPLFFPLGPSCISVNPPPDAHLFEVGAAFDVAPLQRVREEVPGRRLQRVLAGDATTRVVDPLLYDSELDVDCIRTQIGDTLRCLPANTFATVVPYYSDAACTQAIEVSLVERGACDATTKFAIDTRGSEPVVRPIDAPMTTPLYELSTADTCLEYIPPPRQQPHMLGAALPLDRFVDAQVIIDPIP
jgi:hypothetical protein